MLRRYWLRLARSDKLSNLNLGCGITAYTEEDAMRIFENEVVPVYGNVEIIEAVENIDISTLDSGHVLPNMRAPIYRGVWFPML